MKLAFASAAAAAVVLTGGVAAANGHTEQCFDKGTLTYFDCPTAEVAEEGQFYIGARGGAAWIANEDDFDSSEFDSEVVSVVERIFDAEFDTGYVVSAMAGYDNIPLADGVGFRPELEIGYLSVDGEVTEIVNQDPLAPFGVEASVLFGFVNAFVDLEVAPSVDLIVGGGVGFGNVELEGDGSEVDDTTFGFNIGGGVGVEVVEDVTLEAMYRYMSFVDAELGDKEVNVDAHTATVGVRFEF